MENAPSFEIEGGGGVTVFGTGGGDTLGEDNPGVDKLLPFPDELMPGV